MVSFWVCIFQIEEKTKQNRVSKTMNLRTWKNTLDLVVHACDQSQHQRKRQENQMFEDSLHDVLRFKTKQKQRT